MDSGLLIPLLLCGGVVLIIVYVWYFIFGRSSRAVFMAFLGVWLSREDTIDIDNLENLPANTHPQVSDKFDSHAEDMKSQWQGQQVAPDDPPLPRAKVPSSEEATPGPTTHHIGWPRALDHDEKKGDRPFLQSRLTSDSDGGLDNDITNNIPADHDD